MDSHEYARIAACQSGRLEEFDPLYLAHVDSIYRYLLRRTLSTSVAEDLTSTVFLKALEGIRSFDPTKGELRTWLYRIARNTLIDHYRSFARKTIDIESVWDMPSDEVASLHAEQSIDAASLHKALATLRPEQKEIVMLRIWEGLSYKEIAEITGKTEGNAKMIFSRTIAELKTKMPALAMFLLFPHML